MRAKITLALCALLSSTVGAFWLVGCGDSGSKNDGGADASIDDSGDTSDTGVGTDTGVNDTGVKDSGPNCAAQDAGACRTCCVNANPNGALYFQGAIHACVCAGQFCNSCNNNYCAPDAMAPSMNCAACAFNTLSPDGGQCYGPVGNACANNADCVKWFQCQAQCK